MPTRIHNDLEREFPGFASRLAIRPNEPYLVEQVLPPATDQQIDQLEAELRVPLPSSYKRLLRLARGCWLAGGLIQLSGQHPFFHEFRPLGELNPQQRRVVQQKGGGWPPPSEGMLCFAEFFLEADGDQALWDARNGLQDGEYPVFYYAHEASPPTVRHIASSFAAWLDQCIDAFPPNEETE